MRLLSTSDYTDEASWNIVSQCVKHIFADIAASKASARDIQDANDPSFTCTQYLWVTLKAHKVMMAYFCYNIFDHPSVALVLTIYLTTHSQSLELVKVNQKMKACESKINKLITCMNAVTSKLDTITSCIVILEKKK